MHQVRRGRHRRGARVPALPAFSVTGAALWLVYRRIAACRRVELLRDFLMDELRPPPVDDRRRDHQLE